MAGVASAKRHAQAVFQLALDHDNVEEWRNELRTMGDTLTDPELAAVLENPKIQLDDKIQVIGKCLPGSGQLALNFAYLLVSRQRIALLPQIVAEYERMADAKAGLEHARVVTAVPLDDSDKDRLASRLADLTGKQIVLATEVDPDIIGGFVARIGDRLIDGSTRARLQALKKRLAEGSST